MKLNCATAFLIMIPWVGLAQGTPAARPAGAEMPPAPSLAPPQPVSVPVPVVRVPTGPTPVSAATPAPADGKADVSGEGAALAPGATGLNTQLGWSSTGVGLREPSVTTVRTNRGVEMRGVLPRAARPERKGVGGFFSGFANLFNPFAPVAKGTESRNEHWYDGGVQSAPLPRGFRDERYHEPKTDLFSTGLERGKEPEATAEAPAKRESIPVPAKP